MSIIHFGQFYKKSQFFKPYSDLTTNSKAKKKEKSKNFQILAKNNFF